MAVDKKEASSVKKTTEASAKKTESVKRPVTKKISRKTSTQKPATASNVKPTKVTRTQVRKPGSTSVRNRASQNQVKAVEEIQLSKKKMERDSFTMPKDEYAQLAALKKRLETLGRPAKKSELLRAGIKLLSQMTDAKLKTTMLGIPVIKTGRPKKKK